MKFIVYPLAILLGFLGLSFVVAANRVDNSFTSILVGLVCLAASVSLIVMVRLRPSENTVVNKMELDVTGDVNLEQISCEQCTAKLTSNSIKVVAGAVFVHCEFCGAEYQIEEAPKW